MAAFAALGVALVIALGEMFAAPGTSTDIWYTWIQLLATGGGVFPNGFSLVIGTLVSPISALMLLVVNIVGAFVMLYSIGYMHRDSGLARYYALLSLFLTSMNGLVLSDNLLEFFIFWELVGVCSYFLIGFYYEKPSASSAAKEAFLVTRVGDVLFLLGIFIYFFSYATAGPGGGWAVSGFRFTNGNLPFLGPLVGSANTPLLTVAGIMILAGAAGKSAQFPLDVWLPDAMEGPTTVSALIHAATMVAAGVFLLAVTSVYIGFTPVDLIAIAAVGAFTLLYAASMAIVQSDIKRVIAYSTVSQLGFMTLAIGAGFTMVGLYHLFTHAFFKALLFLAAGAVIHAVSTQDMFRMGALQRPLRVTSAAFVIGGLALTGIPPFAGFWSKDDIVSEIYLKAPSDPALWPMLAAALVGIFLTGYYIFRAYYLVFSGDKPRDPTVTPPHEAPWSMRVPILGLAALSVVAGVFVFLPDFPNLFIQPAVGIPPTFSLSDLPITITSTLLGALGIGVAYYLWGNGRLLRLPERSAIQPWRELLVRRYHMKEAYDWVGLPAVYTLARGADFVDQFVIDGTIHGFERTFSSISQRLRRFQSGIVSDYAALVATGLIGFLLVLLFAGPYLAKLFGGG